MWKPVESNAEKALGSVIAVENIAIMPATAVIPSKPTYINVAISVIVKPVTKL